MSISGLWPSGFLHNPCATPVDSETGWTGELWPKEQDNFFNLFIYFFYFLILIFIIFFAWYFLFGCFKKFCIIFVFFFVFFFKIKVFKVITEHHKWRKIDQKRIKVLLCPMRKKMLGLRTQPSSGDRCKSLHHQEGRRVSAILVTPTDSCSVLHLNSVPHNW